MMTSRGTGSTRLETISVIIPAYNSEPTLRDALRSAEESIACLRDHGGEEVDVELVVVDDGSSDATLRTALEMARGKDGYRVLHRTESSSPACARNCGVAASRGNLILYLDADDRFLADHIRLCHQAMRDPAIDFVKTSVALSDAIHPDWAGRIGNSLVLNLAVRRSCHEAIGGFPDFHLARRDGEGLRPEVDIFRMIEDVFYNTILSEMFRGGRIAAETVLYRRHSGNSFDRQYEKFRRPFGAARDELGEDFDFRVHMSQLIIGREKRRLASKLVARGPEGGIAPG